MWLLRQLWPSARGGAHGHSQSNVLSNTLGWPPRKTLNFSNLCVSNGSLLLAPCGHQFCRVAQGSRISQVYRTQSHHVEPRRPASGSWRHCRIYAHAGCTACRKPCSSHILPHRKNTKYALRNAVSTTHLIDDVTLQTRPSTPTPAQNTLQRWAHDRPPSSRHCMRLHFSKSQIGRGCAPHPTPWPSTK